MLPLRLPIALLLLAGAAHAQQYDLLLKGGHVVDPKNGIDRAMDVAISGGKIARVAAGINSGEAKQTADVTGLYVTPGLIDIHAHVYLWKEAGGEGAQTTLDVWVNDMRWHEQPNLLDALGAGNAFVHSGEKIHHVAMLDHHPFRAPGGPRSIDYVGEIFGGDPAAHAC